MQSRIPQGSNSNLLEKKPKPKLQKLSRANSESNTTINNNLLSSKTTTTTNNQNTKVSFNSSSIPTSNIITTTNDKNDKNGKERRSSTGGIRSLRNKFQALSGGSKQKSPPSVPILLPSNSIVKSRIASGSPMGEGALGLAPTTTTSSSKGPGPMIWKEGSGWGSNMIRGYSDPTSARSSYSDRDREEIGVLPNGHRPSLDSIMASNIKLQPISSSKNVTFSPIHTHSPPLASTSNLNTSPTTSYTPIPIGQASSSTSPWATRNNSLNTNSTSPISSSSTTLPTGPRRFSKDFERSSNEPTLSQLRSNSLGINSTGVGFGSINTRRISTTTRKPVPPPEIPERAISRRISNGSFRTNVNGNGDNGIRMGSPRLGNIIPINSTTTTIEENEIIPSSDPPPSRFGYSRRSSISPGTNQPISSTSVTPTSIYSTNNTPRSSLDPTKKDDLAYRRLSLSGGPSSSERKTSYRLSTTPSILLEEEPKSSSGYSRLEKGKGPEIVKNRVAMYQKDANTEWTKTSNTGNSIPTRYRSGSMTSETGTRIGGGGGGSLYGGVSTDALGTAVLGGSLRRRNTQWTGPNSPPVDSTGLESMNPYDRLEEEKELELELQEKEEEGEEIGSVIDSNKSDNRSLRSTSTTPDQNGTLTLKKSPWPFSKSHLASESTTSSRDPLRNPMEDDQEVLRTGEEEERYARPESNMSRNTFGSPGGPQEFTTPPPSPPPRIESVYSTTKPIPLTPPRSLKRSQSASSDMSSNFRALNKRKEDDSTTTSVAAIPRINNSTSNNSKFLQRRATDGKKWSSRNSIRRGSEKSLRPRDSMSPVGGWSAKYLEEAEVDADITSSKVDWKNLNPSAERFNAEELSRRKVKNGNSPLDDLIDGMGGRRASEGTIRLEDSMVGYYTRDQEEEEEEDERSPEDYFNSHTIPRFKSTTSAGSDLSKSISAPVLDSNVPPGYGRALSVEEMEAEIERMESELANSRSNRRLVSTFDTSSSLAASSNQLARLSTDSSDTANFTSSGPHTPHHSYLNRRTLTSSYSSSNIPDSPGSEADLTPQTARRWSIVEVELAYERMKGMLGSTRSLGISERASEEDIASAFDRAIGGAENRNRDSNDFRSENGNSHVGFRDSFRNSPNSELRFGSSQKSRNSDLETFRASPIVVERSDSISSSTSTLLVNNRFRPRSFSPTPTSTPYSGRRHTEEEIKIRSPTLNYNSGMKSPTMVRRSPSSRSLNILLHRQSDGVDSLFDPIDTRVEVRRIGSISPTSIPISQNSNLIRSDSIETRSSSNPSTISTSSKIGGGGVRGSLIPLARNLTRDSTISTAYDTASEGGSWTPSRNGALSPAESNSTRSASTIPRDWNTNSEGERSLARAAEEEETNWLAEQSSVTIRQDFDYRFENNARASESPIDRFLYQKSPRSIPPRLSNSSLANESVIPDSPTLDFLNTFNDDVEAQDMNRSISILGSEKSNGSERNQEEENLMNTATPRKRSNNTVGSESSSNSGEANMTTSSIRIEDIRTMNESELLTKFTSLETDLQKAEMERDAYLYALERSKKVSTIAPQDPKEIELTVQREKNFSQILGSEPKAQVEKLREIVSERNQALEELETAREDANILKKALLQGLQREEDLERESVTLGAKLVAFAAQHGILTPNLSAFSSRPNSPSTREFSNNGYPFPSNGSPRQFRSPPKNPLRPLSKSLPSVPPSSNPTTPTNLTFLDSPTAPAFPNSPSAARLAEAIRGDRPSSVNSITGNDSGLGEFGSPLLAQTPPAAFEFKSSFGSNKFGRGPPPLLTRPSYSRRNISGVSTTSTTDSQEFSALDRRPGADNRKESNFLNDLSADF